MSKLTLNHNPFASLLPNESTAEKATVTSSPYTVISYQHITEGSLPKTTCLQLSYHHGSPSCPPFLRQAQQPPRSSSPTSSLRLGSTFTIVGISYRLPIVYNFPNHQLRIEIMRTWTNEPSCCAESLIGWANACRKKAPTTTTTIQ